RQVRGFCIIINNQVFADPELTFRSGSRADAYRLSDVFSQLGFDVHMYDNQTSDQMKKLLMGFRNRETELSVHEALVVIILSHGCEDGVHGSDGQVVPVKTILGYFNNDYCTALIGKPKMFFLTACRGDEMDQGVRRKTRGMLLVPEDISSIIPTWSDIFVYYSTIEGYLSPRNTITGSWFGYELAHCLAKYSATEHLNDLVTIRVAKKVDHRISRLNGTLVFKSAIECKTLATLELKDWKDIRKFGHSIETSGLLTHELCEHYSTTQWMTRLSDLVFTGREFTSKLTMFEDPELTFRSGSRADAYRLSDVFSQLGFDVHMYDNQTSGQMTELLMRFRDREADLSTHDALVVIILSHGCKDGVYGSEGQVVSVDYILGGYSSPRNTITGSWFGYELAHCLAQYSATEHLNDLMTIRVAQYVDHRISQIPGVGAFKSAIECKTL
ncbi:unnamed protein product, partial [Oppiella nova]